MRGFVFALALLSLAPVYGEEFIPFKAELVRVVDGDTVIINLDLGFDVKLMNQYIRLHDIDTPERRDPRGPAATLHTTQWFEDCLGQWQFVSLEYRRGKYGRILGDFRCSGRSSLIESLKAAGHEK